MLVYSRVNLLQLDMEIKVEFGGRLHDDSHFAVLLAAVNTERRVYTSQTETVVELSVGKENVVYVAVNS